MSNALVILGAGASHDVVDPGNPYPAVIKDDKARPPLTSGIFVPEGIPGNVLPTYPGVRELASSIRYRTNTKSLETVLKDLGDSDEPHRKAQMLSLPLYLQHIFWDMSELYVTEPVNYTHIVGETLELYDRVAFLTLNYDLLLDGSLTQSGYWGTDFSEMDSYVRDRWMLVKMHGSVNWGRRVTLPEKRTLLSTHIEIVTYRQLFSEWPFEGEFLEDEPVLVKSISDFRVRNAPFYPALSVPVEGKYEYNCPKAHIEALVAFLPTCRTVIAIGTSGKDQDMLDLLSNNLGEVEKFFVVSMKANPVGETVVPPQDLFASKVEQLAAAPIKKFQDRGFTSFLLAGGISSLEAPQG